MREYRITLKAQYSEQTQDVVEWGNTPEEASHAAMRKNPGWTAIHALTVALVDIPPGDTTEAKAAVAAQQRADELKAQADDAQAAADRAKAQAEDAQKGAETAKQQADAAEAARVERVKAEDDRIAREADARNVRGSSLTEAQIKDIADRRAAFDKLSPEEQAALSPEERARYLSAGGEDKIRPESLEGTTDEAMIDRAANEGMIDRGTGRVAGIADSGATGRDQALREGELKAAEVGTTTSRSPNTGTAAPLKRPAAPTPPRPPAAGTTQPPAPATPVPSSVATGPRPAGGPGAAPGAPAPGTNLGPGTGTTASSGAASSGAATAPGSTSATAGQPGGTLRTDGPTFESYVASGNPPANYPPAGFAAVDSQGWRDQQATMASDRAAGR